MKTLSLATLLALFTCTAYAVPTITFRVDDFGSGPSQTVIVD